MDTLKIEKGLYDLADILGVRISHVGTELIADGHKVLDLDGVKVKISPKVSSTKVLDDGLGVIVRLKGNLASFLFINGSVERDASLYLLNLAKMDGLDNWFKKNRVDTLDGALAKLDRAIVRKLTKKLDVWTDTGEKR